MAVVLGPGDSVDAEAVYAGQVDSSTPLPDAIIVAGPLSIKLTYRDGVFAPLDQVEGALPGAIYTAFSDEELRDFLETPGWLRAAEKSFEFWDNPADAVYDTS